MQEIVFAEASGYEARKARKMASQHWFLFDFGLELPRGHTTFVAKSGGDIIGYAIFGEYGGLRYFFVDKQFRKLERGTFSEKFLTCSLDWQFKKFPKLNAVQLSVMAPTIKRENALKRWYERIGFRIYGRSDFLQIERERALENARKLAPALEKYAHPASFGKKFGPLRRKPSVRKVPSRMLR